MQILFIQNLNQNLKIISLIKLIIKIKSKLDIKKRKVKECKDNYD
jgi:hypothetical protein